METIKYCNLLHAKTHSLNLLELQLFSSVQFIDKWQCLFKYLWCALKILFLNNNFEVKYAWIILWSIETKPLWEYGLHGLTSDLQISAVYNPYMEELAVPSIKRTDQR